VRLEIQKVNFSSHFMQKPQDNEKELLFELSEALKNENPKLYKRVCMVYYHLFLSYTVVEVAKKFGTTPKTVRK
jgi:hypothetical protein